MTSLIMPTWRPTLEPTHGDADLTWAYPWPAGERLAADLHDVVECRGKRGAELGCGRGRCGLTALLLGAREMLFTDLSPQPLAYVTTALAANGLSEKGCTAQHLWGTLVPMAPFELLIGADILYRPTFHHALLHTIALSLDPQGICLLADPRSELEPELPLLAAQLGLTWAPERRLDSYTLVRIRHLAASSLSEIDSVG